MSSSEHFDAIIIGGGPGGVTAALRLSGRGMSVAVIEERLIGGECHYWACNPTKTLIRPIEVLDLARAVPGVREVLGSGGVDVEAVFGKRDAVIDHLDDHDLVAGLTAAGVEVVHGRGRLDGERTVAVVETGGGERRLHAERAVVLATGTRPFLPDVDGLESAFPWTNRDLATMTRVPDRAIVVGGGVVGVECATILSGLGSAVTLLARGSSLLRGSEPFAGMRVAAAFRDRGVDVRFGADVTSVQRDERGGVVVSTDGLRFEADEIVVATGRLVNTENLGLETVGLPEEGFVAVDDHLSAVGLDGAWLYAIGDTTGRALLSHVSQYHAGIVADVIASRADGTPQNGPEPRARDAGRLAQIIFTNPQVVEVGLTEAAALQAGFAVTTRNATYPGELGELLILRDGFEAEARLVVDADRDTLLGATFVGTDVADLVQAATVAVVGEVPLSVLRHVIAPHPSLSQIWNPLVATH